MSPPDPVRTLPGSNHGERRRPAAPRLATCAEGRLGSVLMQSVFALAILASRRPARAVARKHIEIDIGSCEKTICRISHSCLACGPLAVHDIVRDRLVQGGNTNDRRHES